MPGGGGGDRANPTPPASSALTSPSSASSISPTSFSCIAIHQSKGRGTGSSGTAAEPRSSGMGGGCAKSHVAQAPIMTAARSTGAGGVISAPSSGSPAS